MQRPRVKPEHRPIKDASGSIFLSQNHSGLAREIKDPDGTVWRLLELLDGSRTQHDCRTAMTGEFPTLGVDWVDQSVDALADAGVVEDAAATVPPELQGPNLERYQRNVEYFGWVQTSTDVNRFEAQVRLHRARVLIVGLGGSGSSVALALAAAGVGALHLVDPDVVDVSNLSRQLLYTEADLGSPKAERAAIRLAALNSAANITFAAERVGGHDDFARLLTGRDLLVLCADEPADTITRWANRAAIASRTPWVTALYSGPTVSVASFQPGATPCYDCYWRTRERPWQSEHGSIQVLRDIAPSSAALAPTVAITGNLAALEAIAILSGLRPARGGSFHQSMLEWTHTYQIRAEFQAQCPACALLPD